MTYNVHIKNLREPTLPSRWMVITLQPGTTPEGYVALMAGVGAEVLSMTPVVADVVSVEEPTGDFNQDVRDRNGTLAVELRRGEQVRTWSVDDNWGWGLDTLLNEGWRISDYFGKRSSVPPQHDYLWGGWLIDGHPLNVITGLGWIDGQLEVLRPYISDGEIPEPHLMRKSAPVAPDVLLDKDLTILIDALEETNEGIRREVKKGPGGNGLPLVAAGGLGLALVFLANKFF